MALWESDVYVDENTLSVNVNRLRRKLETIGLTNFILTRKGIGYQIKSDQEMRRTLRAYIKQYLNRYKGGLALVAGLMIFHIFVLYICGIPAADIRYLRDWNLYFCAGRCILRDTVLVSPADSKRQIRDYMQGMQALSDTEDALEEVYMDALEQLQNKRQEEREHTGTCSGKWKNIMLCGCIRSKRRSPRCVCFCRGKNKNRQIRMKQREWKKCVV